MGLATRIGNLLRGGSGPRQRQSLRMDRQSRYAKFAIGRYTYGSPEILFASSGAALTIGQFCSIANGVKIFLGGEHRVDWITTYPFSAMLESAAGHVGHPATKGSVTIGNDVWIGHGATILSGVTIGDGAVIGAGALVAKNIPAYSIAAGNPANVVRTRFSSQQIEAMLRLCWWNWPIEVIEREMPSLLSADIDGFIRAHGGSVSGEST